MKRRVSPKVYKTLRAMSDKELEEIEKRLRNLEWVEALGSKPADWNNLPDFARRYEKKCVTKVDMVIPYLFEITRILNIRRTSGGYIPKYSFRWLQLNHPILYEISQWSVTIILLNTCIIRILRLVT